MNFLLRFKSVFLLVIALAVASCSSDDNNDSETFIKFKIDDTSYFFKDIISAETNVSLSFNGNNGPGISNPGDTQIAILIPADFQLGSFEISGDFFANHKIIFSSDPLEFDFDSASNGNINITSTSGDFVIGTFAATVTNNDGTSITITNGEFKCFKID